MILKWSMPWQVQAGTLLIFRRTITYYSIRYNHGIYWHSTHLSRRGWVGCGSFSWYPHPTIFHSLITDFARRRNRTRRWVGVLSFITLFVNYTFISCSAHCGAIVLPDGFTWSAFHSYNAWFRHEHNLRFTNIFDGSSKLSYSGERRWITLYVHYRFRDLCSPADLIGLRLLSRACYNPDAAPA